MMSDEREPVTVIKTPVVLDYSYTPGRAQERFLLAMKEGKLLGLACDECGRVYIPARGSCPRCAKPTTKEVEVKDTGTVATYSVVRVPSANIEVELPYCAANILLDGADLTTTALIQECKMEDIRIGMRVQAVWRPKEEWDYTLSNIKYFKPLDEPDVPFDEIKEYS
jgi:uncharacterized OB-fold protein